MGRKSISEERRKEILLNYYEVIKEEGFEGASIAKIAHHMGIQPSLIIHYFGTKEDMLIELSNSFLQQYIDDQFETFSQIKNIRDRFNVFLDLFFGIHDEEKYKHQEVIISAIQYLSSRNGQIKKYMNEMSKVFIKKISDELSLYINAGIIGKNNIKELVNHVMILISGYNNLIKNVKMTAKDKKILSRQSKELVLRILS